MKAFKKIILFCLPILFFGCGSYSFTGTSIADNIETFQVSYFQNTSDLVEPGLDRDFTQALQELILNQTNLSIVNSGGDLVYEGEITEYRISPTTAQSNSTAAQNRLTIGVNVRFYDKNEPEEEFEQRFSFFFDYDGGSQLIGSQKDTAIEEIFERITQDVFNATLAKW